MCFHSQFELYDQLLTLNQHVNAFDLNDKVWMKDSDGFYTVLAWVVEKAYNKERDGWDYRVMRRDISQTKWLEGEWWRAETELKQA